MLATEYRMSTVSPSTEMLSLPEMGGIWREPRR
jgi:hypothetical protein